MPDPFDLQRKPAIFPGLMQKLLPLASQADGDFRRLHFPPGIPVTVTSVLQLEFPTGIQILFLNEQPGFRNQPSVPHQL